MPFVVIHVETPKAARKPSKPKGRDSRGATVPNGHALNGHALNGHTSQPSKPLPLLSMLDDLRRQLATTDFPPDTQLDSPDELAQEYGCTVETARIATQVLMREGLIDHRRYVIQNGASH